MTTLNIQPTGWNILVEQVDTTDAERTTEFGIIIPQTGEQVTMRHYKVLSQGPDLEDELVGSVLLASPMELIGYEVLARGVAAGPIFLVPADYNIFRGVLVG